MSFKVCVLMGGQSAEREISLSSGEAVFQALHSKGYEVKKVDAGTNLVSTLLRDRPDVVFIALHGQMGEDGTVQGLLEIMGLPYTGSGVLASALCMNKILTKRVLFAEGIPTPDFQTLALDEIPEPGQALEDFVLQLANRFNLPLVVKTPGQGSTIGVYIAERVEEVSAALVQAAGFGEPILIEQFIPGQEITVGFLGDPAAGGVVQGLPPLEIVSHKGIYDYEAKYTHGLSEHLVPARLPAPVLLKVQEVALAAFQALHCRDLGRVDLIVKGQQDPFVLEVNTIPGLTNLSLLPDAARAAGIAFEELVERLVKMALARMRTGS